MRHFSMRRPARLPGLGLALLLPLLPAAAATAEEADTTVPVALPPLVVSATSTERTLRDAPASVTVISRQELTSRPVQDLADALRGTPGITLGGVGFNRRGIGIRGMPSDHTLVLVDGKRVNVAGSAIAHADFDLGWIPMEAIERIEVVRGPMSSLYGSEALGGVVNVITRRATDRWEGSLSTRGSLHQGRGGNGYQAGTYLGGPLVPGVLGLSVWAEGRHRDEIPDADDRRLSEIEHRKARSANATLTWTPDEAQRIDLGYGRGREDRWRNTQTGGPFSTFYRFSDVIEREQVSLSHRGSWSWGDTSVRAYRAQLDRRNRRSEGQNPTDPQRLIDEVVDAQVSFPLLESHLISLGGEGRRERLRDSSVNARGRTSAVHAAFFLQDEIAFSPDWQLVVGSRFDHHEDFGWNLSPRVHLLHHWNDALTFRAGVGRGFKAPTLKQLSPGYEAVGGGGRFTIVGNPDLKPETSTTYEVGAAYQGEGWSLGGALFQNDLRDLIQTACVRSCGVPGAERREYENVDRARIRGLELEGGLDLPWQLRLDGNYTFLDARDRTNGGRLAGRPRHGGHLALAWASDEGFSSRLRADYVGKQVVYQSGRARTLSGYSLWSLDLSQSVNESFTLRAGIENLTDKRLADSSTLYPYAEPGRVFWAGFDLRF